jgi:hypothetical protein
MSAEQNKQLITDVYNALNKNVPGGMRLFQ